MKHFKIKVHFLTALLLTERISQIWSSREDQPPQKVTFGGPQLLVFVFLEQHSSIDVTCRNAIFTINMSSVK